MVRGTMRRYVLYAFICSLAFIILGLRFFFAEVREVPLRMNSPYIDYLDNIGSETGKKTVRIVSFSDTHGFQIPIEFFPISGEVLIFAGDFSWEKSTDFLGGLEKFNKWMGNHDINKGKRHIEDEEFQSILSCCVFLNDKTVIVRPGNIKIHGTSFSPNMFHFLKDIHPDWESYDGKYYFRSEEELLRNNYGNIPKDTNILVTHIPPKYILDHIDRDGLSFDKGSKSLVKVIEEELKELKVHIFGHMHQCDSDCKGDGRNVLRKSFEGREIAFINTSVDMKKKKYFYVFDYHYD